MRLSLVRLLSAMARGRCGFACIRHEGSYDVGDDLRHSPDGAPARGTVLARAGDRLTETLATSAQDTIATKDDVANSRSDVKADIANLRSELKADTADLRSETKEEIAKLRTEMKQEIAKLRTEMIELKAELKGDIADLKAELIKWIVGAIVLNLFGTAGLVITLTKILAH